MNGEKAYHNSRIYKERTKRWHDKRIKEFTTGDKALRFDSRVKLFRYGKLRSKWERSFTMTSSLAHGAVTFQNNESALFKVNGHRLKIFLEPKKNAEELDIIEFLIFP